MGDGEGVLVLAGAVDFDQQQAGSVVLVLDVDVGHVDGGVPTRAAVDEDADAEDGELVDVAGGASSGLASTTVIEASRTRRR
ncbi:hypothetical protein [Streptomyces lavenduligriseus]|uniref:Uncharacterized protein n=1 Tax=Streptomyces lavenduligriseus TaxID=67315 RepID=A0ABT0P5Z2_9ACTN|nr:hypothetical protein [Streptomyces lavenduligriseus]MCL3999155.1 hypothetical protein [Streptomyces lavenduligriseus]